MDFTEKNFGFYLFICKKICYNEKNDGGIDMSRTLLTGVAYHGNRMPSHAAEDMLQIARADMDIVVHMLSHIDWVRHKTRMKDIFHITKEMGLDVWVDNWGLAGSPGDTSYFLAYHPEAHCVFSNGEVHPTQVCINHPSFRKFTKDWLNAVVEIGGETVFWDEPTVPTKRLGEGQETRVYCCHCEVCKKLFLERYGRPMPTEPDEDFLAFRTDSIVDYFRDVCGYSASLGLKNAICIMPGPHHGITMEAMDRICKLPGMDNIGYDPYWFGSSKISSPYEYVYNETRKLITLSEEYKKDHNLWIQAYGAPRGREEEIIEACEAAYDAGARTLLAWGYRGSESNNYASANPERSWLATVEGMRRVRERERDRLWEERRRLYCK